MRTKRKAKAKATHGKESKKMGSGESTGKGKIKGRDKGPAEESVEKDKAISKEPVDIARVRKDISNMVGNSATELVVGMINAAAAGELAPAKYLFEMAGLYPATEETEATNPQEDSLAHILLKRMGLPIEPVITEEDSERSLLAEDTAGESERSQRTTE